MTKRELVARLAERLDGINQKEAEVIVDVIFDSMTEALTRGERIEIRGFGSFHVKKRDPREGRNPRSGEKVFVTAKKTPFFKVGKELRKRIDQ